MSLPSDEVYPILQKDYVLVWKNIQREAFVGQSFGYTCRQKAVGTTNGAGPHNVQIFMLSPDEVVLHALPGFWHPEDLARELRFGKAMLKVWTDKNRTPAQKKAMFRRLQLTEARYQPSLTTARSGWQSFDAFKEQSQLRSGRGPKDLFMRSEKGHLIADERGKLILKPLNVVVHQRMAKQPFVKFEDFDIPRFVDYGQKFYDNNRRHEKRGKPFSPPPKQKQKKRRGGRR